MPLWHSRDLKISSPPGIIQSGTRCLQPNALAWPWHVPSRHPHQSHRGSPGPLPAATSRQLVRTWREMTAKHPALGSSFLLWGSRGWLGCTVGAAAGSPGAGIVMGVSAKHLSQWSQPAVGWHLAAWNCFVSAVLSWWSFPPCPSER